MTSKNIVNFGQFVQISNKIFDRRLDLTPKDILVFIAVASHGGKTSTGIFPSWQRISAMVPVGRSSVAVALARLRDRNMITWYSGHKGRSNSYEVNPCGLWILPKAPPKPSKSPRKSIPKEEKSIPNQSRKWTGTRPGDGPHPSSKWTTPRPGDGPEPYPLNHINEPGHETDALGDKELPKEPGERREYFQGAVKYLHGKLQAKGAGDEENNGQRPSD